MMGNEDRYCAALLYAGAEPDDGFDGFDVEEHMAWQSRCAYILLHKYRNYWWYDHEALLWDESCTPEKHRQALEIRADVSKDELKGFYTWVRKHKQEDGQWSPTLNESWMKLSS